LLTLLRDLPVTAPLEWLDRYQLGSHSMPLPVHNPAEIEAAIATLAQRNCGLNVALHAVTVGIRHLTVGLAARHGLPAVYGDRAFAESRGPLSFGINTADMFQRSASYIDRILKGAKPADLSVQLPTKFELIINLKTAKELTLHVRSMMPTRADELSRDAVPCRWCLGRRKARLPETPIAAGKRREIGSCGGQSTPRRTYLKRRFSRESWLTEVHPISFMPRSISARIRPSARSTPGWPAAARA